MGVYLVSKNEKILACLHEVVLSQVYAKDFFTANSSNTGISTTGQKRVPAGAEELSRFLR